MKWRSQVYSLYSWCLCPTSMLRRHIGQQIDVHVPLPQALAWYTRRWRTKPRKLRVSPPIASCTFSLMLFSSCILLHRNPNSVHVSENASETQMDTTMTFTVLIVSIEQNEEFQESRVHYTLAGIKPLLKIGEEGSLAREGERGGSGTPGTLPWLRPCFLFFSIQRCYKQGFWYFARSRTHEIQVFPRNTAKSARNISKYMSAKHI